MNGKHTSGGVVVRNLRELDKDGMLGDHTVVRLRLMEEEDTAPVRAPAGTTAVMAGATTTGFLTRLTEINTFRQFASSACSLGMMLPIAQIQSAGYAEKIMIRRAVQT